MLFNEIYSAYYNAMAVLINKAIDGELNYNNACDFIKTKTFRDSFVYILEAIKSQEWQLMTKDYRTPIKNKVRMPLSSLQKRFLKSVSLDKRFRLFTDQIIEGLDEVEPLYYDEDFCYFDIIKDGDPYDSPEYIDIFRTVLRALKEGRLIHITFVDGRGNYQCREYTPRRLEYSEKDDKFRLICLGAYRLSTINLARISCCELRDVYDEEGVKPLLHKRESIIMEIIDERNALERCMLHFSDFEKTTTRLDEKCYEMKLTYNKDDETEVLIRVLSFGPMVKVKSPDRFIDLLKERLLRQRSLDIKEDKV